jgi:CRISPR system Cascade subunit CasB
MEEKISWSAENLRGKMLHQWWHDLHHDTINQDGRLIRKADRASCAILRRCATLDAVALSDAYQRFYRYMLACNAWPADASPWQNDKLAAIAGLLAHIKTEGTQRLPKPMSELDGDRPQVSELRFRNLLKVETTDDLFTSLLRVLPLIDKKKKIDPNKRIDIYHLANDVYFWGDKTKKDWAYSYIWPVK